MRLKVTHIVCNSDLTVKITFNDGKDVVVDIGKFIRRHPHPQYNKYLKFANFRKAEIENGNVVWGRNWDLVFPVEDLHENCI